MSFCKYTNNDLSETEHTRLKDDFKKLKNKLSSNGIQIEILVNIPRRVAGWAVQKKEYTEKTQRLQDVIFPQEYATQSHDYHYLLKINNVYVASLSVRLCKNLRNTIYINYQTKRSERGKKYSSLLSEYFIIDRYFNNTKCIINNAINKRSEYSQEKYGFELLVPEVESACVTRSTTEHKKGLPLPVNGRLDLTDGDNIKKIFAELFTSVGRITSKWAKDRDAFKRPRYGYAKATGAPSMGWDYKKKRGGAKKRKMRKTRTKRRKKRKTRRKKKSKKKCRKKRTKRTKRT